MKRTVGIAAGLALAIGIAGCERGQTPTAPATNPSFSQGRPTTVAFEAELNRTSPVSVSCNQGVCDIGFQASGAANIMGSITYIGHIVQDFTTTPCNEALAELTLTGPTGSISLADNAGSVCPSPSPSGFPAFISSSWQITGGTGEFSGISGDGISRGSADANGGPVVHLSGSVVY